MSSKSSLVGATTPENRTANPGSFHVFWLRVQRSHPLFVGTVWVSFSDFSIRDSNFCIAPSSKFYQHVGEKKKTGFYFARAFERGTPKRTTAAWPEKGTTENAICDENIFFYLN